MIAFLFGALFDVLQFSFTVPDLPLDGFITADPDDGVGDTESQQKEQKENEKRDYDLSIVTTGGGKEN